MKDTPRNYESDTPEACEAVERWQQGKINIFDEMARLERERDEALAGRDEADVCRKLERECDELREQLYIAVGMLSTHPTFENKHPEEVWEIVKEAAK